jgi:hypothetical protein
MNNDLTPEEREILEQMMQEYEKMKEISDSEIIHVPNADKYAFPLGFDDSGKQFPIEDKSRLTDKPINDE